MHVLVVALLAFTPGIRSPSGNISCFVSHGTLVCAIRRSDYGAALQRQCQSRAGLDWHGFEMSADRRAQPVCSGGALSDSPPRYRVLAYGSSWRSAGFVCTSRVTGLTCRTGTHTLFVSRQRWSQT